MVLDYDNSVGLRTPQDASRISHLAVVEERTWQAPGTWRLEVYGGRLGEHEHLVRVHTKYPSQQDAADAGHQLAIAWGVVCYEVFDLDV